MFFIIAQLFIENQEVYRKIFSNNNNNTKKKATAAYNWILLCSRWTVKKMANELRVSSFFPPLFLMTKLRYLEFYYLYPGRFFFPIFIFKWIACFVTAMLFRNCAKSHCIIYSYVLVIRFGVIVNDHHRMNS